MLRALINVAARFLRDKVPAKGEGTPDPLQEAGARSQSFYRQWVLRVDWRLLHLEPKIAIAQLRANYQQPDGPDTHVRHVEDSAYDERLFATLTKCDEVGATFVLFPEYAWPRKLAARVVSHAKQNLREGTVWLLPFEHVRPAEFTSLLTIMPVAEELRVRALDELKLALPSVDPDHAYVNVCFVLLCSASTVTAIPQVKMRGAALEEKNLAGGRTVYVVQGVNCNFATSICFDSIARDEAHSERPRDALAVHESALDFLLVPECNPTPLHHAYARAIIALGEDADLAPSLPYIIFANVAARSSLPALMSTGTFGFSRVIGRLGKVSATGNIAVVHHDSVVALDNPSSLKDVAELTHRLPFPKVHWLTVRPQESLFIFCLPRVRTGPSSDPTVHRANTSVDAFRWASGWQRVRGSMVRPVPRRQLKVPSSLVSDAGLVGADEIQAEFLETLGSGSKPLWLWGQGGIGKTALAASALHDLQERKGVSILWVDLAELDPDQDALREHVLLQLGHSAALRESPEDQWLVIRDELCRRATVLVLDSRELWLWEPGRIPAEVQALHGWPCRVVVTARNQPLLNEDFAVLEVPALDQASCEALIMENAARDLTNDMAMALAGFAGGSPLAATWIGGALASGKEERLGAAAATSAGTESALQAVFSETTRGLSNEERSLLTLLSRLPQPLAESELGELCDFAIRSAIDQLQTRHLIVAGVGEQGSVHTAHPFVRQFVKGWEQGQADERLAAWADRKLNALGGDRNWSGYPLLSKVWANIQIVLESIREREPRRFLRLWRLADYFLWSTGRLRERERLGRVAVAVAKELGDAELLVHALYDSVAECRWHRSGTKEECSTLLDEAEQVADKLADPTMHKAMIEHYRSRMFRHFKQPDDALAAASRAIPLAQNCNSPRVLGLCENALGNVYRSQRRSNEALAHFDVAADCFEREGDLEMQAIVLRNQGRCYEQKGESGRAIEALEKSIELLRQLHLYVECAEAALDHATALHTLGENDEAEAEVQEARELFSSLGAVARVRDAEELLGRIARRP
jgi:tetratricopeptide (TPR) repeat protein